MDNPWSDGVCVMDGYTYHGVSVCLASVGGIVFYYIWGYHRTVPGLAVFCFWDCSCMILWIQSYGWILDALMTAWIGWMVFTYLLLFHHLLWNTLFIVYIPSIL